jgi:hypothetical protein
LAVAQSEFPQNASDIERQHSAWIGDALRAMQTIKAGMTRADLLKVFTTEGGLSAASGAPTFIEGART